MMTDTLLALVAFSPILVAAVLLVGLNWPAKRAMPVAFLLTVFIALWGWQMSPTRVFASTLRGLVITVTVLWIVFQPSDAQHPQTHQRHHRHSRRFYQHLAGQDSSRAIIATRCFLDRRGLGFWHPGRHLPRAAAGGHRFFRRWPPLTLGVIQSTPVSFGAVGTPSWWRKASTGLDNQAIGRTLSAGGSFRLGHLPAMVTTNVAPHSRHRRHPDAGADGDDADPLLRPATAAGLGLSILPFAIFAGLAFTVPYALTGMLLAPSFFPVLIGGLVGLALGGDGGAGRIFWCQELLGFRPRKGNSGPPVAGFPPARSQRAAGRPHVAHAGLAPLCGAGAPCWWQPGERSSKASLLVGEPRLHRPGLGEKGSAPPLSHSPAGGLLVLCACSPPGCNRSLAPFRSGI